jgi:SAM-dependent methyltransferase
MPNNFDEIVQEALEAPFSGWDFSYIKHRWHEPPPPWDYKILVLAAIQSAQVMLDMGTGGGEFLEALQPLPPETYATEAYEPNISLAQDRLEALGVRVVSIENDNHLPLDDGKFDLIINRHEAFWAEELNRILKPGGIFITQQVGDKNLTELNEWLTGKSRGKSPSSYEIALHYLQEAGLEIIESQEAFIKTEYYDVGAIVYLLKAAPWQIKEYSPETHRHQLRHIYDYLIEVGTFTATDHRFLIMARKPEG